MQAFHHSFKIRQALVKFTPEEVKEILREQTYTGVMLKISEIRNRKKEEKR